MDAGAAVVRRNDRASTHSYLLPPTPPYSWSERRCGLAEQLDLQSLLAGNDVMEIRPALDAAEQQLWAVRQAAVPLLQKLPGPKRITEFIEDVTVHPDVLAQYMSVTRILQGSAPRPSCTATGDGNIHTRPVLDLKQSADLAVMQRIMDEVMDYA